MIIIVNSRYKTRHMRYLFLILTDLLVSISLHGQTPYAKIADSIGYDVLQKCEQTFPKFHHEFQYIKTHDTLIKKIVFIRETGVGPAFASPKGLITINLEYFKRPKPNFDDNRLIVVLYHEVGHLHYYVTIDRAKWNPEDSEKAAFEYSLLKTKALAARGDCLPLKSGLKFMKLRSQDNNLKDAHVRALKRMVNEPLYADYVAYAGRKCKD